MTKRNDTESRTPSTDSLSIQHLGRGCGVYRWCALIAAMHWSTWMPCTCSEGEICKHFPRRVAGNGERVCNHRLRQVGLFESACSRFARMSQKFRFGGRWIRMYSGCTRFFFARSGVSRTRARSPMPCLGECSTRHRGVRNLTIRVWDASFGG